MTSPSHSPLRPPSIPERHVTRVKWENIGIIGAGLAVCGVAVALIMSGGATPASSTQVLPPKQLNSTQVVANDASMATTPEAARALMVKAQLLVDDGKYDDALEVLTHIDTPLDAQVGAVAMRDRIDALRIQAGQFADAAEGAAGAGTIDEASTDAAGSSTAATKPAGASTASSSAAATAGSPASTTAAAPSTAGAASSGARPNGSTAPATGGLGSRPIAGTGALPPELQAIYDSADPALIAQVQAMVASSDPKAVAQLEATIAQMMSAQSTQSTH